MPTYSDAFLTWGPVIQLWAVWNERDANRKALTEKDAEIARLKKALIDLETDNLELAKETVELAGALAECQDAQNPPPPAPAPIYDATRLQVIWPAFNTTLQDWAAKVGDGRHVYAAVVMADLKNKGGDWAQIPAMLRSKGIKVFAYVRAPVHIRIGEKGNPLVGIGTGAPFERAVYNLVRDKDAFVRDTAGNIMLHSGGYDAYTVPWEVWQEHAEMVRELAWDANIYDGLLVDGLTTNQIYANPAAAADYDRNGLSDVQQKGWANVSLAQYGALSRWAVALGDVPVIGNGAWEPDWEIGEEAAYPWKWLAGAYDEDGTHPIYLSGDNNQQAPALSGRWRAHLEAARVFVGAGREYWMGGNYRLFNLMREQGMRFLIASALIAGARVVANESHSWWGKLGKAKGEAKELNGTWSRDFEGGKVVVDPTAKTGAIL